MESIQYSSPVSFDRRVLHLFRVHHNVGQRAPHPARGASHEDPPNYKEQGHLAQRSEFAHGQASERHLELPRARIGGKSLRHRGCDIALLRITGAELVSNA